MDFIVKVTVAAERVNEPGAFAPLQWEGRYVTDGEGSDPRLDAGSQAGREAAAKALRKLADDLDAIR